MAKMIKFEKTEKGHGKKHEMKETKAMEKAEHKVGGGYVPSKKFLKVFNQK